jgi:hypothetical protein
MSVFVSCKNKLPNNIESAVRSCELEYKIHRKSDSIILNHTTEEIDKMPLDTISKLIGVLEINRDMEENNEKELKELLKINPEYSDYDEVKNMKKSYYNENLIKSSKIKMYLEKQYEKKLGIILAKSVDEIVRDYDVFNNPVIE